MLTTELKNQFRHKLRFKKRPIKSLESKESIPPPIHPKSKVKPLFPEITYNFIKKSQQDPKNYRAIVLPNEIKVTLISDPTTSKSAACMSIEVGHMSDPVDTPGLAHLCEHALFLGSEKFPTNNDFRLFLNENGGSCNAQTFADVTKYFFDVLPDQLEAAIERFSQMFIAPLFENENVIREISAVNNEHEKNLASDAWRLRMVNKRLAVQSHDYTKFGTGNKSTLLKPDICKELKEFHKKFYKTGNLMNLTILGTETLDRLEAMAKKYFMEDIENFGVEIPRWDDKIYDEEMMRTVTYVVPIKDVRTMTLQFQTPCLLEYFRAKPEQYIINCLAYESRGSVLYELRKLRWCTTLNCDHVKYAKGFGFFEIKVDLTDEGYIYMNDIIKLIFQYLNLIKRVGIKNWIFEELKNLAVIEFRFEDEKSPINLVSKISSYMRHYPLTEILTGPTLINEFRIDLIEYVLDMLVPDNLRVIVVDQTPYYKCNCIESIYETKYGVEKIRSSVIREWKICGSNPNFKLPEPNIFIPSDFLWLPIENWSQTYPKIIKDTSLIRVWFKQDEHFRSPKTILTVELKNPTINCDPLNWNMTHIFVWMLQDYLREKFYGATLAGIDLQLCITKAGIRIFIEGFSDKLGLFLETILREIFKFKIDLRHFEDTYDAYLADLKGFEGEKPQHMGIYYLEIILNEQTWSNEELLLAMKVLTLGRLKTFAKEVLTQTNADCLIFGNVNEEKAIELTDIVEDRLEKASRNERQIIILASHSVRERKINEGDFYTFQTINEYHKYNCISYFIQCGLQDDKSNVILDLILQIIRASFFDVLRTQEQQGYLVDCIVRRVNGTQGIKFVVESSKHPEYIEERIKIFLITMHKEIEEMCEEKFLNHKTALKSKKKQKPLTLAGQFWQYHKEIVIQNYHFNRHQVEASILKEISLKDICEFYEAHISPDSASQKIISIHIISKETMKKTRHLPSSVINKIENLIDFKNTLQLNPRKKLKSLRQFYSRNINKKTKRH
ncbi:hypothetical protein PVAND_017573 [Polypedilum vanderplanki]|uniref:Insulin-degrading enzyme n=1 Tax=Polypedilum vanderplanki TaxID=319348 RepID=A0A9J6BJ02_POLVA|nr:hypothetical protein PVAND_017573 [Polypedilum vanderplanki]